MCVPIKTTDEFANDVKEFLETTEHTKNNKITWKIEFHKINDNEYKPVDHYIRDEQIAHMLNHYYGIFKYGKNKICEQVPQIVCNVFSPDFDNGNTFSQKAIELGFPTSMTKQEYHEFVKKHENLEANLECLDADFCFEDPEDV